MTKAGDDGKVIEMKLPNVSLQLQMQSLDSITVDQPISFAAVPQGLVPQIMDSLSYEWNFGDLATSSGNKVTHVFKSSGVYAVTVYAQYTRYQQIARKTITVLPVSLDLTYNRNGDLLIENNTAYEIDASNFILHGTTDIVFPPRTIILPHAVITVQKSKIPISQGAPIALFDPQKELVATAMKSVPARVTMAVTPTPRGSSPEIVSLSSDDLSAQKIAKDWSTSSNFLFTNTVSENGTGVQESTSSPRDLVKNEATTGIDVTGSHEGASTAAHMLPYVGLFGVIAAGLFAIFAARI